MIDDSNIVGVKLSPLKQIKDNRGKVMHMLRNDSENFVSFGEVYFSWINPGVIKGWSLHKKMILNYAVPVGNIKVVLYDARESSETYKIIQEVCIGENDYRLLTIPNNIWYGFKSLDDKSAMIVNCASIPHDPDEIVRQDIVGSIIPFDWSPLVSVIIPTHNRSQKITNTINSILEQTYKNLELIIVSNGSTDNTAEIIKAIQQKDARVVFREQENSGGPSSPRNHGMKIAKGKYIAFCDDDDIWLPEKLELQISAMEKNFDVALSYTDMTRFDEKGEYYINNGRDVVANLDSLLYKNVVPISSVVIRKNILQEIKDFNESVAVGPAEDYDLILRVAAKFKLHYINKKLLRYWEGGGRTTSGNNDFKIVDALLYLKYQMVCFYFAYRAGNISVHKFILPICYHLAYMGRSIVGIIFKKAKNMVKI